MLKDNTETTSLTERSFAEFVDDEFVTVDFRPELIVEFTLAAPEPATGWLLGLAIVGKALTRRRRNSAMPQKI
jgi:hypothetical protein